ncbi:MAG TPA: hypothetical protein VIK91_09565, partial [Nannocystis sp.]
MPDETTSTPAGQWPDASLWPSDDDPPIVWARFYRDHCGWIVLPTASRLDVLSHASSIARKEAASYALDSTGSINGDIPDEVADLISDRAREEAEAGFGRPIGYIYKAWMAKVVTASDITDDMLREAWDPVEHSRGPRAEADTRGIAIVPGRSSKGLPVCLVDVDVGHGDSPAGDVNGPWGWGLPGPKASTPRGGLHTLMLSTGKETASADLGPGIDVVASGTPIPLPAGSATPGRRWLRKDAPVVAPDDLRRRGRKKKPPPRPGQPAPDTGANREPGDDEDDEGRGASIIASATGDGSRNQDAPVIVGILARPRACPEDFVRACLELLTECLAGRNAHADEIRAESERWHHLLTRGPRDVHFATEVVETWLEVRGDGTRMRNPPAKLVASVWKVCDRREEGNAGAEDFGYGSPLGLVQAGIPAPVFTPMPEETADNVTAPASEPSVPYPPPSAEQAAAAVAASRVDAPRWRGGIDPATYALTLGECYTREDLQRDLLREPIEIAQVFPAVDFSTGYPSNEPSRSAKPVYFGWGEHMNSAKRGLSSGEFLAVGAASAGAGKTTFIGWLVNGLALATAARLLGHADFADAPLVLPVWVSEMPKKMEIYGRLASSYLGFDMACL